MSSRMFLFEEEKIFLKNKMQLPSGMIIHFTKMLFFFPNKPKLENKTKIVSGKDIHGVKLSRSLKLEDKNLKNVI